MDHASVTASASRGLRPRVHASTASPARRAAPRLWVSMLCRPHSEVDVRQDSRERHEREGISPKPRPQAPKPVRSHHQPRWRLQGRVRPGWASDTVRSFLPCRSNRDGRKPCDPAGKQAKVVNSPKVLKMNLKLSCQVHGFTLDFRLAVSRISPVLKGPIHMPIDERQERIKALDVAVGQIEKQFGKGSIMRLGQNKASSPRSTSSRPAPSASTMPSASAACRAAASSKSSGRNRPARPRSPCRSSPKRKRPAAWRRSSTPNTRSMPPTPRSSASTSTTCWSRSPTTASRRSKSSKCSIRSNSVDVVVVDSVAALVPQAPKSKATWARRKWACRRA